MGFGYDGIEEVGERRLCLRRKRQNREREREREGGKVLGWVGKKLNSHERGNCCTVFV